MRTSQRTLLALAAAVTLALAPVPVLAESNVTSTTTNDATANESKATSGIYGVITIPGITISINNSGLNDLTDVVDVADSTNVNVSDLGDVDVSVLSPSIDDNRSYTGIDLSGLTDVSGAASPTINVDVTRNYDLSRPRETNVNLSLDLGGVTVNGDLGDALSPVSEAVAEAITARQAARLARLEALRNSLHISTSRTRDNDASLTVNTDHTTTTIEHEDERSVSYDTDSGLDVTHDTSNSVAVTANLGGGSNTSGGSATGQDDEATGSVTVEYVADDGTVLKARSYVLENARVGRSYYTSQLSFSGYSFAGMANGSAPASGTVAEGTQSVVYVYTKSTGVAAAASGFDDAVGTVAQAVSGAPATRTATTTTTVVSEGVPTTGDSSISAGVIAAICGFGVAIVVGAVIIRRRSR